MDGTAPTNPPTAQAPPPSTVIAALFAKAYYKALHDNPTKILQYYAEDAEFSRLGGKDEVSAVGHETILQRLQSLGYEKCKVLCDTLDCQRTLDDGLVVVAIGHMANFGFHRRPFVQTFVLERRAQSHYLVRNDILRYTDGLPVLGQIANSAPVAASPPAVPSTPPRLAHSSPSLGEDKSNAVPLQYSLEPAASSLALLPISSAAAVVPPVSPSAPVQAVSLPPSQAAPEHEHEAEAEAPLVQPAVLAPTAPVSVEVAPLPSPTSEPDNTLDGAGIAADLTASASTSQRAPRPKRPSREKRPKKLDKAPLVGSAEPAVAPLAAAPAAVATIQEPARARNEAPQADAVAPPASAAALANRPWSSLFPRNPTPGTAPSPRFAPNSQPKPRPPRSLSNGVPQEEAKPPVGAAAPVNGVKPYAAPESLTVSINNLPLHINEEEVQKLFSSFGDIKQIQMPQPYNPRMSLCFVHYYSPDSVARALEARPLFIGGLQLNAEKRPLRAAPRSAGRSGMGRGPRAPHAHPHGGSSAGNHYVPTSSSALSAAPSSAPVGNGTNEPSPSGSNEDKDGAGFERVSNRNRYRTRGRGGGSLGGSRPPRSFAANENKNENSGQNGSGGAGGAGKPNGNRKRKPMNATSAPHAPRAPAS